MSCHVSLVAPKVQGCWMVLEFAYLHFFWFGWCRRFYQVVGGKCVNYVVFFWWWILYDSIRIVFVLC